MRILPGKKTIRIMLMLVIKVNNYDYPLVNGY